MSHSPAPCQRKGPATPELSKPKAPLLAPKSCPAPPSKPKYHPLTSSFLVDRPSSFRDLRLPAKLHLPYFGDDSTEPFPVASLAPAGADVSRTPRAPSYAPRDAAATSASGSSFAAFSATLRLPRFGDDDDGDAAPAGSWRDNQTSSSSSSSVQSTPQPDASTAATGHGDLTADCPAATARSSSLADLADDDSDDELSEFYARATGVAVTRTPASKVQGAAPPPVSNMTPVVKRVPAVRLAVSPDEDRATPDENRAPITTLPLGLVDCSLPESVAQAPTACSLGKRSYGASLAKIRIRL